MSVMSPSAVIRSTPERSFVRVNQLPGTTTAARQAASRAARSGELIPIRRGLYYRGVQTRYGMTRPRVEEIAREVLGEMGSGPAGYSAAREWGVTTQVPASFHVATLWVADPIEGVTQHARRNRERVKLNTKEIALIELLRAPEVYVEAGWDALVQHVRKAFARGDAREDALCAAVAGERNTTALGVPAAYVEKDFWVTEVLRAASTEQAVALPDGSVVPVTFTFKGDHAITVLGETESAWKEFASFDVNVLAPERTLFEKLAAVHDAASRNDTSVLLKQGRHFYDIHRLVENTQVAGALEAIDPAEKQKLIDDIDQRSLAAGFSSTIRPTGCYANSPAFDPEHPSRAAIETGYSAAQQLIYGERISLDDVTESVRRRRKLL
ncbi:hypothetical protein FQR65_LT14873 [Abscondita terminalis]|nr:hypothetical protein FQR65_LT14873 [Abscondita terminalis]